MVFDANDTVTGSQWYADRGSPDPATEPEPLNDPERRAHGCEGKHANTPGIVHFDSLGRLIYAISDYGGGRTAAIRSESDLTGRFSKLFDQEKREVASGFMGMVGRPIYGESSEKGRRWTFQNVLADFGKKLGRAWAGIPHRVRFLASPGQHICAGIRPSRNPIQLCDVWRSASERPTTEPSGYRPPGFRSGRYGNGARVRLQRKS